MKRFTLLFLISVFLSLVQAQSMCRPDLSVMNAEIFEKLGEKIDNDADQCALAFYTGEGFSTFRKGLTGVQRQFSFSNDFNRFTSKDICTCEAFTFGPTSKEREEIESRYKKRLSEAKEDLYIDSLRSKKMNIINKVMALQNYSKFAGGAGGVMAYAPSCVLDSMMENIWAKREGPGRKRRVFQRRFG